MDDEAAFRFSDLENRARTDISDLERGRGYLEALSQFYDNDRNRMAERIGISLSQLNRYILLAKLDEKFVDAIRSEEHTSELQSLMRISYAVFCLKKKTIHHND